MFTYIERLTNRKDLGNLPCTEMQKDLFEKQEQPKYPTVMTFIPLRRCWDCFL